MRLCVGDLEILTECRSCRTLYRSSGPHGLFGLIPGGSKTLAIDDVPITGVALVSEANFVKDTCVLLVPLWGVGRTFL